MPYPQTLSVSVLHATFWLTLGLVAAAWVLPQANETDALESLWKQATAPVTERAEGLSRVFVGVNAKKPVRVHSFDSTLPIQGSIELPETQVLNAEVDPRSLPFLRAKIYELYTSGGWKQDSRGSQFVSPNELFGTSGQLRDDRTITVDSRGRTSDVLFSQGQPASVDRDAIARFAGDAPDDVTGLENDSRVERGETYEVAGSVSMASEDELRAAGTDYPDWVRSQYLELPGTIPQRVHDLANDLTAEQPTAYDQATTVQNFLRQNYAYDLNAPKTPVGADAVDHFLFESRRGYFDHHASAMVVLLRSAGIPARLAVGYALRSQERQQDGSYLITERSAYAWPEVYFEGLGWVEFNPTPDLPPIVRPGAPVSDVAPAFLPEEQSPQEPAPPAFPEEGAGAAPEEVAGGSNTGLWIALVAVGGFFALVLATGGGLRLAWNRGMGGLDLPSQLWEKTVRLASWNRLPPNATQTPREYARTLRDQVPDLDGIDVLAESYVEHRFGGRAIDEDGRARLQDAWRSVRGRLVRRLLRRR
jgi:transglutaminase-like putative cysteine protease